MTRDYRRSVRLTPCGLDLNGASPGTISTWDAGYPTLLSPVGGKLLVWEPNSSTTYLINPATRTRTTLRLRGIPRAQYVTLAW